MSATIKGAVDNNAPSDFNLSDFKKANKLTNNIAFKPLDYYDFSPAMQEALSIRGVPKGYLTTLRGHSDSGKSTQAWQTAIQAQKDGDLPVFIITEMKFDWEHLISMGLEAEPVYDEETGELLTYEGNFIYTDISERPTIEAVADFITLLLKQQKAGKLPYNLCIVWDSIGSVPSKQSVETGNNNNMWNAGALSREFGGHINQQIGLSRRVTSKFINTMICVNKIWMQANPMGQPTMKNKGGDCMWYDAALQITFGGHTTSGTKNVMATKGGKKVLFAKVTKVKINKNHFVNVTSEGSVMITEHGFLQDTDVARAEYKKAHSKEWLAALGTVEFDLVEEDAEGKAEDNEE